MGWFLFYSFSSKSYFLHAACQKLYLLRRRGKFHLVRDFPDSLLYLLKVKESVLASLFIMLLLFQKMRNSPLEAIDYLLRPSLIPEVGFLRKWPVLLLVGEVGSSSRHFLVPRSVLGHHVLSRSNCKTEDCPLCRQICKGGVRLLNNHIEQSAFYLKEEIVF